MNAYGPSHPSPPVLFQVRVEGDDVPSGSYTFGKPFTIGRSAQAALHLPTNRVSRHHAEVVHDGGRWWLQDTNSTNGVYHEGERTRRVALDGATTVRLGREGPFLHLECLDAEATVESEPASASSDETMWAPRPVFGTTEPSLPTPPEAEPDPPPPPAPVSDADSTSGDVTQPVLQSPTSSRREPDTQDVPEAPPVSWVGETQPSPSEPAAGPADSDHAGPDASVSQVIGHYFDESSERPAGDRTMMIREAYKQVQKKQQRAYGGAIGAVAALLLVALAFVGWQQWRVSKLEATTEAMFYEMKEQDLAAAQFRLLVEAEGNAELTAQLDALEARQRRQAELYAGHVEELGLYRKLDDEEREIYRVARIFNESEFTMPAGFVREIKETIREWQSSARFENDIRRAEENGYTGHIVRTFQAHGLPPEFFYLAMQESDFKACAVGPETRWGIAKGMWQFIPPTGEAYGLVIGPRADIRVCDPLDDRHDFEKSTEAAARYLLYIYTELAQASGLLAMASYNWGEHRVIRNLDRLPETPLQLVREDVSGVPENPQQRNYWTFLSEYRDRMPEETKGYVLHIFAAAVIGQNPRLFGFDFDNPLKPYLEESAAATVATTQP